MRASDRPAGRTRRRTTLPPRIVSPRRVGPAELYGQVAPLLAGGAAGEEALARLATPLQEDPALLDLRFEPDASRTLAAELAVLDDAARERHTQHALPSLVPPHLGREAERLFVRVEGRSAEPVARRALALGRYFALLDDLEGASGAGQNPLWHLLFELTLAELPENVPLADALAFEGGPATKPAVRAAPSLSTALRLAVDAVLDEEGVAARTA